MNQKIDTHGNLIAFKSCRFTIKKTAGNRMKQKIKYLTKEEIEEIYYCALDLLEQTGVIIKNLSAQKILKKGSVDVDRNSGLVKISSEIVKESIKKSPKSVSIYDRNGRKSLVLEKDNVYFNPGSTAINFLESNGNLRRPVSKDLQDYVKLVGELQNIHAQSTSLVISDVSSKIADRYRLYIVLNNSIKPIITGAFSKDGLIDMKDMLVAVRGDDRELSKKPLAIFDVCPSSPLLWNEISSQNIIDCAKYHLPIEIISMPLEGGTSPVTIAGSLVQHTAENLSGIVLAQLTEKGSRIIYGGSPSAFDMRYGTTPMAAIETIMTNCAISEIGKYFDLPTHAYLGLSDSKVFDQQAGLESSLGLLLGSIAGINVISGPGMLEFEKCQSMEKLVMDNELCGMCLRLIDGISVSRDTLALDIQKEIGHDGNFLSSRHTLRWFRKEQYIPSKLIDRQPRKMWIKNGSKDGTIHSKEQVKRILDNSNPKPLDKDLKRNLDEVVMKFAKENNVRKLPLGP